MAEENQEVRRVFISYSWTSPEHEQWVIDLAERLTSDGIDVVLDKWELTEGQDKYAFMEKMVTDTSINKVLAVCDKRYAEKADGREGGVGTESQIISKEVYESVDQKKFIPIVTEYNEQGGACLPTFFKSRIYIDMSTPEKANENYQKLVRNIYDKPLHKKPTLGKTPSYILDAERIPSKTLSKLQSFKDALLRGNTHLQRGLVSDYLSGYFYALEDYRINWTMNAPESDEIVWSSIQSFLPYRDEFIDFITFLNRYGNQAELYDLVFDFFQDVLKYRESPQVFDRWNDEWADNYHFIMYELFLYLITALIKDRRFEETDIFLGQSYLHPTSRYAESGRFSTYRAFFANPETIRRRNNRLGLRKPSLTAELIRERATHPVLSFDMLMQTDLILFLRCITDPLQRFSTPWFPQTLYYADYHGTFDLFAKAESKKYFQILKTLLKIKSKEDLQKLIQDAREDEQSNRLTLSFKIQPWYLINLKDLDTRP